MVRKPYPRVVKLCALLETRFDEISSAYYQTPNVLALPHWKLIGMVYSWCIERVPEDKLDDWIADLDELLPWQDADSEAAAELESASFFNMQSKGG